MSPLLQEHRNTAMGEELGLYRTRFELWNVGDLIALLFEIYNIWTNRAFIPSVLKHDVLGLLVTDRTV